MSSVTKDAMTRKEHSQPRAFASSPAFWISLVWMALTMLTFSAHAELRAGGRDAMQTFKDPKVVALVQAIEREDLSGIDRAIEQGANINGVGEEGQTPLHWSLLKVGIAVQTVQHLLNQGADPNAPMSNGESPLHITAGGTRPDLLELLLRNRGNPNVFSHSRRTPLMDAIASQFDINVQLLLEHGADPNQGETCASTVANARFDYTAKLLQYGLSKDLPLCGRLVQRRVIRENSPREVDRKKVISLLAERGVTPSSEIK